MTKQKQNRQTGSTHLVLIIILIVIIIGGLGFVFWQNLHSKNDTPVVSGNTQTDTPTIKTKTGQIDAAFPAKLSWTYPENWTVKSEGSGPAEPSDSTTQKFTLTSPSGKYEVLYYVGLNGGLGGTCEPGEDVVTNIKRTSVTGFNKGLLFEAIHGSEAHGFMYTSSLFQNSNEIQAVNEGDSYCNIYLRNIIPLTDDGNMVLLAAEVTIKQFSSAESYGAPDTATIKKAYEDPEYKTALEILLSTVSN